MNGKSEKYELRGVGVAGGGEDKRIVSGFAEIAGVEAGLGWAGLVRKCGKKLANDGGDTAH